MISSRWRVEVGQPQVAQLAGGAQRGQVLQRVQVAQVAVLPPVELQQVQRLCVHAPARHVHSPLDYLAGHWPRRWHPFGEGLHLLQRLRP
jgi:hypothetical protein